MDYKILIALIMLSGVAADALAQEKYFTRHGFISFYSHTQIEDIDAKNNKVASVLDAATGQLEFAVLMKAFEFRKALMQEHFNENYVESNKYPKAQFKGKILNISNVNFTKDGEYPVRVEGDLTIKGVSKPISTEGRLIVKGGLPQGVAEFKIKPTDYGISIPAVVRKNIAEEVLVKVDMPYQPMKKEGGQ